MNKHECYMRIAKIMSLRSHCLKRKVGCVITDDVGHVRAIGFNGPPKDFEHCVVCNRDAELFPELLPACPAVHAEANALLQLENKRNAVKLYTTVFPCIECAKLIANTYINEIFYAQEYDTSPRNNKVVEVIFATAGITLTYLPLEGDILCEK